MSKLVEELRDSIACYRVNYDVDGWQLVSANNPEFSVMHGAAMAIDNLCDGAEQLLAHIERLEAVIEQSGQEWMDEDQELPEEAEIMSVFPTRSKRYDLYSEAMRLVGAKRSKAGLLHVVNWLLHKAEATQQADKGE